MPGDVEGVLHQAMVAERHPNLQSDCHAHAILAVEQKLDKARQVKIADFSHPPLDGVLALVDRGLDVDWRRCRWLAIA